MIIPDRRQIEHLRLTDESSLHEAIKVIDSSGIKAALVIGEDGHLRGIVTDGDIRRGLLKGRSLTEKVSEIMTQRPRVAAASTDRQALIERLHLEQILHLPLIDEEMRVVGIAYLPDLEQHHAHDNEVVIMAGGLGTRLRPITETIPKPMIEVGGRPLLHTMLDTLVAQGFRNITLSLNYLGEVISEYFGDGTLVGANITYVNETQRLGTGGALSLLPKRPEMPFFVMNGDILTSIDFAAMLQFHEAERADVTMAVNKYTYQVPFGVVRANDHYIYRIDEKPSYDVHVNAGIYILSPHIIDLVPCDEFFDMPTLFDRVIASKMTAVAFPMREFWLDIGRPDDLIRADRSFVEIDPRNRNKRRFET